ncbi:c2H2-type domain-containing protein [Caerostris extrusa]|uniref:C2H2-type domain-containing protein n=1 Tax=Caerostris extrusa TaxID=172846 RepID=A0AAV4MVE4_CAEEX|nr:c2H2-type domain-containing protein [Caerostris extrusa]
MQMMDSKLSVMEQVMRLDFPGWGRSMSRLFRFILRSPKPFSSTQEEVCTAIATSYDSFLQLAAPYGTRRSSNDAAQSNDEEEREPLDYYIEPSDDILSSDPSDDSFRLLSVICSQIVVEGRTFYQSLSSSASQNGYDITDPQTCQKLYRRNRRRAVRLLATIARCKIPTQELTHNTSEKEVNRTSSIYAQNAEVRVGVIEQDFSFLQKLHEPWGPSENIAPGPDRLTYHHWRSLDQVLRF